MASYRPPDAAAPAWLGWGRGRIPVQPAGRAEIDVGPVGAGDVDLRHIEDLRTLGKPMDQYRRVSGTADSH